LPPASNPNDITRRLGLPRPFETYAPRTQRRYRAAYEQGLTRSDVTRREREQRAGAPAGLAAAIRREGVRTPDHEPDGIRRLVGAVGSVRAKEMLRDQLNATRQYKETGSTVLGQSTQRHKDAPVLTEEIIDLAPYTYYHPA